MFLETSVVMERMPKYRKVFLFIDKAIALEIVQNLLNTLHLDLPTNVFFVWQNVYVFTRNSPKLIRIEQAHKKAFLKA